MASDLPDIDPGDGEVGISPAEGVVGAAIATAAAVACLSCAAIITGPYCANCGQRNDDMRRSTFVLIKDFFSDTFAFDSRIWRTLGSMAAKPGLVPNNYSHGKRSRYTPPVRLFLFVSFAFFLVLGMTHTMFVAVDVKAKTPAQIAADKAAYEKALEEMSPEARTTVKGSAERGPIVIEGSEVDCDISFRTRFFVRPADLDIDQKKWRDCYTSVSKAASIEIDAAEGGAVGSLGDKPVTEADVLEGFNRALAGVDQMVADPAAFNNEINVWLPRVMFLMAPIFALILGVFIRGRDALLFDHLVLSLYSHATAFAILGGAILLAQFGVPNVFPVAMILLAVYMVAALRRAYNRGWIKTIYSSAFAGLVYLVILSLIVGSIIANQVWRAAA